ncbi:MAG: ABC transporter permease [Thermus sp.]|uniref:ABC transporter permease n=1 Tax=Thermus sp. TaxID=275 RepID=UPI0025E58D6D|nr:ABC transporter permease [Thermus sp.]MCS7218607.1 ABC transporter permease [Thermus sp.]MCX7848662.1 ABC transporter permease [Thermus sp.]MDW8016901.1 ABC transporter permease [Thermus sp.]MDW8357104.1 ABC transporter permease [Thermus sp.]
MLTDPRRLGVLVLLGGGVLLLLWYLAPWAVPHRSFGGEGLLLSPFGHHLPQGNLPQGYRDGWLYPLFYASLAWLLLTLAVAWSKAGPKGLFWMGLLGLLLFLLTYALFQGSVAQANALGERPILRRHSLGLGSYATLAYSLYLLLLARLFSPGGLAFLVRRRGVVVPLFSLLLAALLGGVIVAVLKEPSGEVGSLREAVMLRLDLITYTYQLLFSPLVNPSGFLQSLLLATPLVFTGLAVALGFRGGLFNIGAPGQLILGAIAAMLVGVYLPGPRWLVLPLALLAAALAGGLWGALPGWLKARFGAHEVINTIMLNYIAASLFLFLISANEYKFFGQTLHLPFKYPGYEARSYEVRPEARLPHWTELVAPGGELSFALPLALLLGLLGYVGVRRSPGHRVLSALLLGVAGYLVGGLLPGPAVAFGPDLTSVRLNGAFLLALLALFFFHFYVFRTVGGYELRALGLAPKAAEYGGVLAGRKVVWVMFLAGALAGLAATHYVLGGGIDEYRLKQSLPYSVGFDGIAVALMGQNTPLGVGLAAWLFGILLTGGLQVNLQLGISRELVAVLQALIVLFIAAGGFLPRYFTDPLRAAEVELKAEEVKR